MRVRRPLRIALAAAMVATGCWGAVALKPAQASAAGCGLPAPSTKTRATTWYKAVSAWLSHRDGATAVAVYDYVSGRWRFHHKAAGRYTASIVKADILETLLHRQHGSLSDYQRSLARRMIEESDNSATDQLWEDIGSGPGLKRYNDRVGMSDTTPGPDDHWG
jgi:hypothetical protein